MDHGDRGGGGGCGKTCMPTTLELGPFPPHKSHWILGIPPRSDSALGSFQLKPDRPANPSGGSGDGGCSSGQLYIYRLANPLTVSPLLL